MIVVRCNKSLLIADFFFEPIKFAVMRIRFRDVVVGHKCGGIPPMIRHISGGMAISGLSHWGENRVSS
jgi:hypothetical protein